MDLEVRHLRVIHAIAESGSLRRASSVLHVSQPALSGQLQRIERLVGGRLFERDQTGVVPTPLGTDVLVRAHTVLRAFDELQRDLAADRDRSRRCARIRVAASPGPLLGGMVAWLQGQFPDAEITVRSQSGNRPLTGLLAAGLADVAIAGDYPGHEMELPPETSACPVVTEPTFALLSARHRLCDEVPEQGEVPCSALADHEWVIAPDDDGGCEYIVRSFEQRGVRPNVRHRAGDSVQRALLRAGTGVGFAQATSPGGTGLAIRAIADDPVWYRHLLIWRRNHPVSRCAGALHQAAVDSYTAAIPDSPVFQHWLGRHDMAADPSPLFELEAAEPFGILRRC